MTLLGTLDDMPLTDLLEIFRTGNKSGELKLKNNMHQGSIFVSLGRLVDASISDQQHQPLAVGDAAVLHMLRWSAAEFSFSHSTAMLRRPVTIFHSGEQLIELHTQECSPDELVLPTVPAGQNPQLLGCQIDEEARHPRSAMRRPARLCLWTEQAPSHALRQPAASSRHRFDLMPCDDARTAAAPAELAQLPRERAVGENYQPAAQPARRTRTLAAPNSPLLQAIMRRVRCL